MKLTRLLIILTFFTLSSCMKGGGYNVPNPFSGVAKSKQVEVQTQGGFPYKLEPLGVAITRVFSTQILEKNLFEYDLKLQRVLEEKYDGKSFRFLSKDKTLKAEFELKDSFKIVEKNIYCREYFQTVEYVGEIISNTAVACRGKDKVWRNLVNK